jgi:hypothetical protein
MPEIPEWIQDNFRRGIQYHEAGKSGDGIRPQTVREARMGAEEGHIPWNKPKRMAAWFARHMGDLTGAPERGDSDYPSPGQVAHLLWGGGVSRGESERAQRWAERMADKIERERGPVSDKMSELQALADEELVDVEVEMPVLVDEPEDVEDQIEDGDFPDEFVPERVLIVVATEDEETADGRIADAGSLSWREPPLSLTVNHDPNQRVGRLDALGRVDSLEGLTLDTFDGVVGDTGPIIVARGTLNLSTELGREVAGEVRDGFLTGVSMEVGDEVVEYDNDGVMHLVEGRIGAVSVVVFQAIESARVVEVASAHMWATPFVSFEREALVAASVPAEPPASWFGNPMFDAACPMTVTDEGQVFGHMALWETCHTGRPADVCLTPPRSSSDYAYFLTGYCRGLDDNGKPVDIPVGSLTMSTGHASTRPGTTAAAAIAHYEHTGHAVADVTVGEDEFGIWFAGALRAGVSAEQVRELRGGSLSGDWRYISGGLELVAALAVNVPGFPVPRVQAGLAASGVQTALVAAGVERGDCGCGGSDVDSRLQRLEALVSVLGLRDDAVTRLAARLS